MTMGTLRIWRAFEFINAWIPYNIYIDEKFVGKLRKNGELNFSLPIGLHTFEVKIGWCSSPRYEFSIQEEQEILLEICTSRIFEKIFLVLIILAVLFYLFRNTYTHAFLIFSASTFSTLFLIFWYTTFYRRRFLWIFRLE